MTERNPHHNDGKIEKIVQFVKYCMVGALNTIITLGVIYVCKSLFGWNLYLSNALGYICGVANSFLCNKQWVFHSQGRYLPEAIRFILGFFLCYGLQLWAVWMITESWIGDFNYSILGIVLSGYGIATLLGNVIYTLANFVYNRIVTFR